MRQHPDYNKGFGLVVVLFVILVLAVAGTGTYLYYHQNYQAKGVTTSSSASPKTSGNGSTPGPGSTGAKQSYLTIKEWGVKIPLSGAISDAYYVVSVSSQDSDGQPTTMWLSLTSLISKGCDAALANRGQDTQLGGIIRATPADTDPVSGKTYMSIYPDGVMIGGYYYVYMSWTKDKTCASQSQLQAIDSAFTIATRNAVAAKN